VSFYNRKLSEEAQRFAERRRREDESPRLIAEVPSLQTFSIEISEKSGANPSAEPVHVRRIVVPHAPALFVIPCGDPYCKDGGHDLTYTIMRELRAKGARIEGQSSCHGSVGNTSCARVLTFVGIAAYTSE